MRRVDSTIINARLINNGPTVPRINRVKARKGMITGAMLRLQNTNGCESGENVTVAALTGCPVTALANESSRTASFFGISPTFAKGRAGAPASCSSAPNTGSAAAYAKTKNPRRRRSGPQNRASATIVMKDHDQNRSEEHTSELQSPDHLVCR